MTSDDPTYGYREGSRVAGDVPAATVVAAIERIRARGPVTAEAYVEEAAPAASPIHRTLTWENRDAAHQFRLIQARGIMRSIVIIPPDPTQRRVSVYVHVPEGRNGRYEPLAVVVTVPADYERALRELTTKLAGAQAAVDELREAAGQTGDETKVAASIIASNGFAAVREALRILAETP